MPRTMEEMLYMSLPWEAVKVTARDISDTNQRHVMKT